MLRPYAAPSDHGSFAVHRLGEPARERRLADTFGSDEQPRVWRRAAGEGALDRRRCAGVADEGSNAQSGGNSQITKSKTAQNTRKPPALPRNGQPRLRTGTRDRSPKK